MQPADNETTLSNVVRQLEQTVKVLEDKIFGQSTVAVEQEETPRPVSIVKHAVDRLKKLNNKILNICGELPI